METKTYLKLSLSRWRTISGGAWLALKAERRSEAGPVVEAPALLHFGGTGSLRPGIGHRGPPVVHRRRRLPVLDALTSRARQPHPLLEAQLLAGGQNKRRTVRRYHGRWLTGDVFLVGNRTLPPEKSHCVAAPSWVWSTNMRAKVTGRG